MDFRLISPRSITWSRGARGGIIASRATSSKPIEFQLPRANCTIASHSAGMFKVEIKLNPEDKTHLQLIDWISDLEESSVGTWSSTLSKSRLIYKNGFRLMFFSNTNVFDSNGRLSVDFFKAKSCSTLCTLAGLWTSETSYGLRLNIKQLKFFEDALEYPSVVENVVITTEQESLFIDDD